MPATLRTGPPPLLLLLVLLAVPAAARPQQRPAGTPDPGRVACRTPAGRPGTCVSTADARGCAAFPTLQSLLTASPTLCSKDGPYIVYCCPDVARPTKPLLTLSPPPPPAGVVPDQPAGVTVVTVQPTATVTLTQLVTVEPRRTQTKSPQETKTQPAKTAPKTSTKLTPSKLLQPPPAAVASGGKVTTGRPELATETPDRPDTAQGASAAPGKTAVTRRPVTTTARTRGTAGVGKGTTETVPVTTAKPTTTERAATAGGVTKPATKQQGTTTAKPEQTTKRQVQTTESASVTTKAPPTKAPETTTEKEEPTTAKPAPTTKKSAPTTAKPELTTKKSAPTTERSAPTRRPAPTTPSTTTPRSEPAPEPTTPAVTPSRRPPAGLRSHRLSLGLFVIPPKRLQAPTAAPAADVIVDLPPPVSPSELPAARLAGAEECGQPAAPWVALVGSRRRWLCAGALLGTRLVLTSARCVAGTDPASLVVRLGEPPRAQMSAVMRAVAHPLHAGGRHDLALLLLGGGPAAGGVCLAAAGRSADLFTLGRGLSPFGASTPIGPLRRARMSELGATDCDAAYRVLPTYRREFPLGVSTTEVCVAAADEDTAERRCPQDRGGPLVAIDRRGRHQLVGLMREAAGCGTVVFPNVYTRLSEYAVWLRRTAAQLAA